MPLRIGSAPLPDGGSVHGIAVAEARGDPGVHPSPLLGELLERFEPGRGLRVLDLGPASCRNLEHYSVFASVVRFADLRAAAIPSQAPDPDDRSFGEKLNVLLPLTDRPFDLVLAWDLLNYLDGDRAPRLVRHLASVAAPGARLHAMIVTAPTLSAEPLSYQIVSPGEVAYGPGCRPVPAPQLSPAKVERWLEPFRVSRSVILRHGVRELLAVVS
jgi:hypothetical protein